MEVKQMNRLKSKHCVWDFDSPIYASIFIAQKNAKEKGLKVEETPPEFAFQVLKTLTEQLVNQFDSHVLYLTGKDNYRIPLATILPYKGNRPPKPELHEAVRDYAVRRLGAIVVDGMEAEDMATIEYLRNPEQNVLVHIDKDLDQVVGMHYNPKKDELYTVSPLQANLNLWTQVLTGDRTDNILGIPDLGEQKAATLLEGVNTYRQGWLQVKEAYFNAFGRQLCLQKPLKSGKKDKNGEEKVRWQFETGEGLARYDGSIIGWKDALVENCNLIYLLREEGKYFEPLD